MTYKPNTGYYGEAVTANPSTGAAQDADSLPVATATKNGTDDGTFALTVTKIDTGRYKITGTVPAGYVAGDVVQISLAATVAGIAGKAVVDNFTVDNLGSDSYSILSDGTHGNAALHTEVAKDATVMKAADYTAPDNATITAIAGYLDTEIGDIITALGSIASELANGTYGLSAIDADITTLLGRLTALRAGYLDNLSGGAAALEANVETHVQNAINASVAAITRTGETITADGTEQTIYESAAPSDVEVPDTIRVDLSNMQTGDTIIIREYDRFKAGGGYILMDTSMTYSGVQAIPGIRISGAAHRYGYKLTLQQTAGTYRAYDVERLVVA